MTSEAIKNESDKLLLEQYKLYVEMADRVSGRRVNANGLYISLLTGLLGVAQFVLVQNTPTDVRKVTFVVLGFTGIALCCIWNLNIRSYKQLNSLKFRVIHEMEGSLPFSCYKREWEVLNDKGPRGYLRLSEVERYVPFVMMVPYLVLLTYVLML